MASKFKVGDKVRALVDYGPSFTGRDGGISKNWVYTVVGTREDEIQFFDDNGELNGWQNQFFELVTEESPKKFKVGDRVRCYGTYNGLKEEVRATVTKVRRDGMIWIETEPTYDSPNGWADWAHPKQCRKLVPRRKVRRPA